MKPVPHLIDGCLVVAGMEGAVIEIKLYYLIQNGYDGSCWPLWFTTAEKRDAFVAAEQPNPHDDAVLGTGEVTLHVRPDGSLADPEDGTEHWQRYPQDRTLDPVPESRS